MSSVILSYSIIFNDKFGYEMKQNVLLFFFNENLFRKKNKICIFCDIISRVFNWE